MAPRDRGEAFRNEPPESAERSNKHLIHIFDEKEIYRIDHYLGKETVQNYPGSSFLQRHIRTVVEP
ncbi:MAG: hypothetical protein ACLRS8_12510 [Parabacteroides merdae]